MAEYISQQPLEGTGNDFLLFVEMKVFYFVFFPWREILREKGARAAAAIKKILCSRFEIDSRAQRVVVGGVRRNAHSKGFS